MHAKLPQSYMLILKWLAASPKKKVTKSTRIYMYICVFNCIKHVCIIDFLNFLTDDDVIIFPHYCVTCVIIDHVYTNTTEFRWNYIFNFTKF